MRYFMKENEAKHEIKEAQKDHGSNHAILNCSSYARKESIPYVSKPCQEIS